MIRAVAACLRVGEALGDFKMLISLKFFVGYLLLVSVGWLALGEAWAGSFTVTPVRVFMTPRDRVIAMTIVNEGDERLVLQTDLYAWRQSPTGQDELLETEELRVAPPVISLPPKGRQVVRLAVTKPPDNSQQLTYRLFVREIIEVNFQPKEGEVAFPIALTLSLPIFITPRGLERDVRCMAGGFEGEKLKVKCENKGKSYAQIRRLALSQGGAEKGALEAAVYLLPGVTVDLLMTLKEPLGKTVSELVAFYDDEKDQKFEVPVQ
jgi:fimbrial chaperone protein